MTRARWSPNRDMQDLCVEASHAGWTVARTGGDHIRFLAPSGAIVFGASTPSDRYATTNCRAELSRAWPGWDGKPPKAEPRYREKRPGRKARDKVPWTWDGSRGIDEPMAATFADLWPKPDPDPAA